MTFYNTTNEKGDKLQGYQAQAVTQDQKILNFFELNPEELYTPWEIQSLVFPGGTPITSVRRSINSLTKAEVLAKTRIMKETGRYGRRSHAWMLDPVYRTRMDQEPILYSDPAPDPITQPLEKKSTDGAKKSPQYKLFNVPPLEPISCSVCGRKLSDPYSIKAGVGPVCATKCKPEKEDNHEAAD